MGTPVDSEKTRAKIINAAGLLFAEKGYKGVTVRDIVGKANTHLSALNYHFRSKEALYREVLMEACKADQISSADQAYLEKKKPLDALAILVEEALKEYGQKGETNWHSIVITRECREPTVIFKDVAKAYFQPQTDFMASLIAKATGQLPESDHVRFAVIALIGLVETFGLYGHLIDAVSPQLQKNLKKDGLLIKKIVHQVLLGAKAPEDGNAQNG